VASTPDSCAKTSVAKVKKETRLASYDDAIAAVLQHADEPPPLFTEQTEPPLSSHDDIISKPSPVMETPLKAKPKRDAKSKRESNILPPLDFTPIQPVDSPKHLEPKTPQSVYDFEDKFDDFASPIITVKSKVGKKSKLKIKLPEVASVASGEESDASKGHTHSIASSNSPKVIIDKMTPQDLQKFTYPSPDKKLMDIICEEPVEKPVIQPIRIDISQPKLIIKVSI
jgi:hypothetical protein